MVESPPQTRLYRFDDFVLDIAAYELRRQGRPVKLERQPMELLTLLVSRRGELVTRDAIVEHLWGHGVFIEVETSVNTVVRKVRRALRDRAERPRFIQTVQGKGYRFTCQVELGAVVLAVLPFEALRGQGTPDYVADGLTEETIVELSQIDPERLRVVGRTSSMAYKGTTKSLATIGSELHADYVLEGSVRAADGRWRVASTLIRVHDQVPVWADSFERATDDLLALQADLGRAIAQQVEVRLAPRRGAVQERRQTENPDAYDLYLRGRYYYNQMTPATAERALDCFRQATELDPEYALAWAGIAHTYTSRVFNSDTRPEDVYELARRAAARALAAGPAVAEAHTAFATVRVVFDWDWTLAETHLQRALSLDPTSTRGQWTLGHALSVQQRHTHALAAARRAIELDPKDALIHGMAAQIAYSAQEFDAAAQHARDALLVEPDYWIGHWQLGQAYQRLGKVDEALRALSEAARLSSQNAKPVSLQAYTLAMARRLNEARRVLTSLEQRAMQVYVPPVPLALVYAALNEHERAFEYLEQALAVRDVHLIYLLVDVKWDSLRADPRFQNVLRLCGFDREPVRSSSQSA